MRTLFTKVCKLPEIFILGRLSYFDDVGGKKRYIALGNIFFMGYLRPLHDILMFYIRSLSGTDCTYNQGLAKHQYMK